MEPLDNCWAWTTHITGLLLHTSIIHPRQKSAVPEHNAAGRPPFPIHIPHHHQPKLQRIRRALQDLAPTRPDPLRRARRPLQVRFAACPGPGPVVRPALRCASLLASVTRLLGRRCVVLAPRNPVCPRLPSSRSDALRASSDAVSLLRHASTWHPVHSRDAKPCASVRPPFACRHTLASLDRKL